MCTVSFVNTNDSIIITSNRDEQTARPVAIYPQKYIINRKKITFPKDPKAGGTWYAIAENATVLVLLNGASQNHMINPPYRKSRGIIVLDIIASESPINTWDTIDLSNIEPFTLILFYSNTLYQLRWDYKEKEKVTLDSTKNYIWSSSTLYSEDVRDNRSKYFYKFVDTQSNITAKEMLHFHRYKDENDENNSFLINRNNTLKTLSITQTILKDNKVELAYLDLAYQTETSSIIPIS